MSTEVEKLRGLLRECADQLDLLIEIYNEDDFEPEDIAISEQIRADVKAALSQQAEPVEPAPAQDEWEFDSRCLDPLLRQYCHNDGSTGFVFAYEAKGTEQLVDRLRAELATRPAQSAPQPVSSALSAVTAERDRHLANAYALCAETVAKGEQIEQLRAEVDALRKDAERWRYVSLQGDDMHSLNLLRVDLDDFGGNINAAVDALIDGEAPAMAAKDPEPEHRMDAKVKAAALILAEIDRLDRAAVRGGAGDE